MRVYKFHRKDEEESSWDCEYAEEKLINSESTYSLYLFLSIVNIRYNVYFFPNMFFCAVCGKRKLYMLPVFIPTCSMSRFMYLFKQQTTDCFFPFKYSQLLAKVCVPNGYLILNFTSKYVRYFDTRNMWTPGPDWFYH